MWEEQRMENEDMIKVHLYGRLRRFADNRDPASDSLLHIPVEDRETIEDIYEHIRGGSE